MKLLLASGADVNCKNKFGNTPLWMAKPFHPKEVFDLILSFGANPKIKNDYGISALDAFAAYPEIIEILKDK